MDNKEIWGRATEVSYGGESFTIATVSVEDEKTIKILQTCHDAAGRFRAARGGRMRRRW